MSPVFISYRHEGSDHPARVRAFAEDLRRAQIEVVFDQFANEEQFGHGGPPQGWPRWCVEQATSGRVLIVASPGWFAAYEGALAAGVGLGCAAEGVVLRNRLYRGAYVNPDIRIVLLDGESTQEIPVDLLGYHRFALPAARDDVVAWLSPGARAPAREWPASPPELTHWPVADHHDVREAAAHLLTEGSAARFLPIEGESGVGKTSIGKLLLANGLNLGWLRVGRLDFKGSADVGREADEMARRLGLPAGQGPLPERLGAILAALERARQPTLLLFDTYEAAGDAARWMEEVLLLSLFRAEWLRVVVAGQKVPKSIGTPWERVAARRITLRPPEPEDWHEYGCRYEPTELDVVRTVYKRVRGDPSVMASVFGPKE